MNVFLTGATGGLGRRLTAALLEAGSSVTALARDPGRLPAHPRLAAVAGDLLDPAAWAQALDGAEAIVHLAALTHSPDPAAYDRVNVEGTAALLAARRAQAPAARFVFVSTRAVGARCGAYGRSKARAEAVVRAAEPPWVILRPAEVYGVSRGEALAALARRCARGGLLPMPGLGRHRLAPVHVDDVIAAIAAALTAPAAPGHTYVLAGPEELTFAALADRLAARAGKRVWKVPVPLALLGLAARAFVRFMPRPPLVPDQIPRLTGPKDADSGPARADLRFDPRRLAAWAEDDAP